MFPNSPTPGRNFTFHPLSRSRLSSRQPQPAPTKTLGVTLEKASTTIVSFDNLVHLASVGVFFFRSQEQFSPSEHRTILHRRSISKRFLYLCNSNNQQTHQSKTKLRISWVNIAMLSHSLANHPSALTNITLLSDKRKSMSMFQQQSL